MSGVKSNGTRVNMRIRTIQKWLPVLFFAACHGNHIATRGRTVRHEYIPANTTTVVVCSGGRTTVCYPVTQFHPARYIIHTLVGQETVPVDVTETQYAMLSNNSDVWIDYETGACGGYSIHSHAMLMVMQ